MYADFLDVVLPNESADNYYMHKMKGKVAEFIYLDPEWYAKLFDPNTFFILGSKGSGKTLYAAYMCADIRKNTISRSHTIDVSDYGKLIAMKEKHHLSFTDYLTMWKVILLQKFLFSLQATDIAFWGRTKNFREIQDTISQFFGYDVTEDSFNPITVMDSCEKQMEVTDYLCGQCSVDANVRVLNSNLSLEQQANQRDAEACEHRVERVTVSYTDTWLRSIDAFVRTVKKISFRHNHYLFVDGLDVRPKEINAREYSECIAALVRAVYEINTKILGNMNRKDDHDFKIVALTRTDIFLNSSLVNVTSCISDNCVELDWTYSNEKEFQYSKLYKMMNRVLGWDGESRELPVEKYFNFSLPQSATRTLTAALSIQRRSRLRPRDVVVILRLIQEECKRRKSRNPTAIEMNSAEVNTGYSKYYTDQIKSEMMFQYDGEEIKDIFQMVRTIRKEVFTEKEFQTAFESYVVQHPTFRNLFATHRDVLNVLYSLDVVGWREVFRNKMKMHWHYREVKAIDESCRMPWEEMEVAETVRIIIHRGASKHLLGSIM